MADETVVAEPIEAPTLRPEAMSALDALGAKLFARDSGEVVSGDGMPDRPEPARQVSAPEPKIEQPPEPPPELPPPVAPEVLVPPDNLLDGTPPAPAPDSNGSIPSVDDVFPKETPNEPAHVRELRKAYRAVEERARTLEEKLKSGPQPDDIAQARIAELESRIGEFSARMERTALLEHPAFVKQFEAPIAHLRSQATDLVRDAGLDPGAIQSVLSLTGNERIRAMDQLAETIESPTLRRRLERTVEEIEAKEGERAQVLTDVRGNTERLATQEKIQRHQAMEQEVKALQQTTDGVINWFASEKKIPFFQRADGNTQWNEAMASDEKETRELVTNCQDQSQFVAAVALGVKFPRVYAAYQAERKARVTAEKALSDRRGAEPSLAGSSAAPPSNGATEPANPADRDMSVEAIRKRFQQRIRT